MTLRTSSILRTSVLAATLLASGCGPVAIGAGLASAGGSDTTVVRATPPPDATPSALVLPQPDADATVFAVTLRQPAGRPARLRFEFDAGGGRRRIPAANVVRYDLGTRAPAAEQLATDAAGDLIAPSTRDGVTYILQWRHAADLGSVEARDVGLFVRFGDLELSQPDFAGGVVRQAVVFAPRTLGRELGELAELQLERQSTDPEARFQLQGVLRDRGGDFEFTTVALQYATTAATPLESEWQVIPPATPIVTPAQEADGRFRYDLRWALDPIALGWPVGAFPFWLRVTHREEYPQVRSDVPRSVLAGAPQVLELGNIQIGHAPRIESASVVDPGSGSANGGDPDRPWMRLPVALTLFNPSSVTPMTVALSGTYRVNSGATLAMTPFPNDPQSALTVDLQPLERRRHFFVWNVVADDGLGVLLDNDPPYNPLRVAELTIQAARAAHNGVLAVLQSAGTTTIHTRPFVAFRDNLLRDAERVWSSGDELTNATRDLFFAQVPRPTQAQGRLLGLDQQFEPRQIVPPPPAMNFGQGGLNLANGIYDVVATDFVPDLPDALVWVSDQFFFVTWPGDGSPPTAEPVPGGNTGGIGRGRKAVSFTLANGPHRRFVVVFHTRVAERTAGAQNEKELDLQVKIVHRSASSGSPWVVTEPALFTVRLPNRPGGAQPNTDISPVLGQFDNVASSMEFVLGNLGREYVDAGTGPGLLHQWSIGLDPAGALTVGSPTVLPVPPRPTADPDRGISRWLLERWLPDPTPTVPAPREALVLVRQLDGTASLNRAYDVLLLTQAGGGLATGAWSILTQGLTGATFPQVGPVQLIQAFTADLDGPVGGGTGSDLLLEFRETLPGAVKKADFWLFARRGGGQAPVWRRVLDGVALQDPDDPTASPQPTGQVGEAVLVDVNGDRLLDLLTPEKFVDAGVLRQPEIQHWNYFASALSGVAGNLSGLANSAGSARARLPGVYDADRDGRSDIVAGGRIHYANLDGSYTSTIGGFSGGASSTHQFERVFADTPADAIDILVFDEQNPTQNAIDRLSGMSGPGNRLPTVQQRMAFDFAGPVRKARAFVAPDTAAREAKDLVAITLPAQPGNLRRGRITGGVMAHTALTTGPASTTAGLALVRRGTVPAGAARPDNDLVQDVVVVDAANAARLFVVESHADYATRVVALPVGQTALRITEAPATNDALEDLLVLTVQGQVYRILCYEQHPDPLRGIGDPSAVHTLWQFHAPFANCQPRAFQFDVSAAGLAEGFLLLDDTGSSNRSEVRFLRPSADPTGLGARLIRTPLLIGVDADVEVVVGDDDRDGQAEVTTGDQAGTGLKRVRRGARSSL
jgi:hypothetical protein